jgi:hypothetical protein
MRESTLLLLLVVWACGQSEPEDYVVIEDFLDRSSRIECQVMEAPEDLSVTALRAASDTTVLVLDEPGRRLVELDGALRPVWTVDLPAAGPGALKAPVGMTLLSDTAIAIVEREGLQLIVYSRAGDLIRTAPLGFAPSAVAARPSGELLVTAMPFGDSPPVLLHRFDGTGFEALPVPRRPYPDMFIGALGNTTLADVLPDGALLIVHQFIEPRAFRVAPDGRADRLRVPTPDGTRSSIGWVPTGPILEEEMQRMLVPAAAMSVDGTRSEVYLMTRSGRRLEGGAERALLRLDGSFGLLESYVLDVVGRHMAFLAREATALIVDDEDRFHACNLRRTAGHAATE